MSYASEREMYAPVVHWLERYLSERHRDADVAVFDSSRTSLSQQIRRAGLTRGLPPEWQSWDIRVDVVGFTVSSERTELSFVECKNVRITLAHVSQLLGYSRVARPGHSFLVSPSGVGDSLRSLLQAYGRTDILLYDTPPGKMGKSILIARWDTHSGALDRRTIIGGTTLL